MSIVVRAVTTVVAGQATVVVPMTRVVVQSKTDCFAVHRVAIVVRTVAATVVLRSATLPVIASKVALLRDEINADIVW